MSDTLKVSIGQWSDKGRKSTQQDFHGASVPIASALSAKGVALALADGISSSEVSQEASQYAVGGFLADYYCTPDAWSVKTSVERVVSATNSWLHAQTQRSPYRYEQDRGYVCTFSALVLKSRTAHIFHVGDTRVYRLVDATLEQLTTDHRVHVGGGQEFLGRALGIDPHVDIDYLAVPVSPGELFLMTTDGVHEHMDAGFVAAAIARHTDNLDAAAQAIVDEALRRGSDDNLSAQILRIDEVPEHEADELFEQLGRLSLPPPIEPRMAFDGYTILRELHVSHRSHIHLARDDATGQVVAIKTPSTDQRDDPAYLERFLLEEWVARRIDSPHVLKAHPATRARGYLYVASEYIDGQSLAQWMLDHPKPRVDAVRDIVEQIARGLRAFHRLEMLHQDLRPENVMIDINGVVKLIDFGAVRVAGLAEMSSLERGEEILGTEQYTAPEYFVGEGGTPRSDQFSLGVIAYQMLTGRLPYGAEVARLRSRAALSKLSYRPAFDAEREIPAWIDGVLRKAVHPDPARRYHSVSEFVHELRHPSREFLARNRAPWIERNPVAFWKGLSLLLFVLVLLLLHVLVAAPG
ncbi:MAG TPA: bifunctional protein-serine/threonine kinase/phosphatase [Burkholderiaceae bacterium]|nr:bifunctional protein-serine/threonine kinase/phosphatase [Burkholderiaceae bacterium]